MDTPQRSSPPAVTIRLRERQLIVLVACAALGALEALRDGEVPIGSVDFLAYPNFTRQVEEFIPPGLLAVLQAIDEIDWHAIAETQAGRPDVAQWPWRQEQIERLSNGVRQALQALPRDFARYPRVPDYPPHYFETRES